MMSTAEWLDEKLITKSLGDNINVISVATKPAVPSGEHYLSTIMRAEIIYNEKIEPETTDGDEKIRDVKGELLSKKTSIIIKTYAEGFLKQFIIDNELLMKEIVMYKIVLPKISEILGKYITPKYLNSLNYDVLYLEDLKIDNYMVQDRLKKLDFEHSLSAINILADFHGSSYVLNKKDPNLLERVKKEVQYHKDNFYQKDSIVNSFRIVADEIKSWPNSEKYSERLRNVGEKIWNSTVKEIFPNENKLMVLNHGDFWTNNILFKYENENFNLVRSEYNERIKNIKLVDFQFSRWTTPAIDLHLFFKTSIRNKNCIPNLIVAYTKRINNYLRRYNNEITVDYITSELKRTECYAFLISVFLLPMTLLDPSKALNFDNMSKSEFVNSENNPLSNACKDVSFRTIFPDILKYYDDIGFL